MKILGLWLAILLAGCLPQNLRSTQVVMPTETARPTLAVVVTKAPSITPSPTPVSYCTVSTGLPAGKVNVRSGPGMNHPVVDVVSEGDQLLISGQQIKGWQQVKTPSHTGWFYTVKWCKK